MEERMRKIHCEEVLKEGFYELPIKEIKDMCGYVYPEDDKWEVVMLMEGCGMTCDTQETATIIANQEMIIGMMLKKDTN